MTKWQDIWDIVETTKVITRFDGQTFEVKRWIIVDKETNEPLDTKRGYSDISGARNGASHRFRQIIKHMEKELLGK